MANAKEALLDVLRETRVLLERPDNDFCWSTWDGATKALAELDVFIAAIEAGREFNSLTLQVLFAPTGDLQEVSVSSGWGHEFCQVAERFDHALEAYQKFIKRG